MAQPTRLIVLQRPDQPLDLVCARLRGWDCELQLCDSYERAVAALTGEGADVLMIDAWVEDGMALLTQLKTTPATRALPIVIASAEQPGVVAAHALALGADDVLVLPIEDAELHARIRALSRLAVMEAERRRRETVLAEFGVPITSQSPGVPASERIGILLIGPAGGDQIQVMTALGGTATAAYAETSEGALERLRRNDLDVALITTSHDHDELQRLSAAIRRDPELFDLPVLLVGRADGFDDRSLPFQWGLSDVLFQPFQPEVLRLRVQAWVRQQRLRRRLRNGLVSLAPTTDRLTRLYSHGFLHGYVQNRIDQSRQLGGTLALVSFAVARMGQVNRQYGYAAGDRVLAELGAALVRTSRAEDLPARLGGDRLCLVIDGATAAEALLPAERIATTLSETPIPLPGDRWIRMEVQTGVAELTPGDDAASLIDRAFERMEPFGLRRAS